MPSNNSGTGINVETPPPAGKVPLAVWRSLALLMCAIGLLAITGCRSQFIYDSSRPDPAFSAPSPMPAAVNPGTANYSTNELHEGDTVSITFQYSTNFDTVQKINLDGRLNLDTVGAVKAAGRTVTELQQDLAKLYQPLVKDDVITVKLLASTTCVYVSGAVLRPGTLEMDRPLTVTEAIMASGGFDNSRAKISAVTVLRVENGRQATYHINLKKVLAGEDKTPFYLKPFDMVYVPAKVFNF